MPRRGSRVRISSSAPNSHCGARHSYLTAGVHRPLGPRSQVARQGSAKPLSSVRFRPWPPAKPLHPLRIGGALLPAVFPWVYLSLRCPFLASTGPVGVDYHRGRHRNRLLCLYPLTPREYSGPLGLSTQALAGLTTLTRLYVTTSTSSQATRHHNYPSKPRAWNVTPERSSCSVLPPCVGARPQALASAQGKKQRLRQRAHARKCVQTSA